MADDVKINVSAPGAKGAQRDLQGVAAAEEKVGRSGKAAGQQVADGFKKTEGALARVKNAAKRFFGLFVAGGAAGVALKVLASMRQELEEIQRSSENATRSLRAVMALSALKGERQEVRDAVWKMAVESGRPIEQVAPAYYTLLGGTAGMGPERQTGLMQQAMLMAKTDPGASLDALVNLFSTMGVQQPQLSEQQIGNLISRTIEQAKSTPEEMAGYLPPILSTARAAGADLEVPLAMFSFATRQGGGVATSGTAVRAALMGLLAPTPDIQKQLGQYGFPAEGDIMSRLGWLISEGGNLPPEVQAALGGRRGIEAVGAISAQPEAFEAEVQMMRGTIGAPDSLLKQRLRDMYGETPAQRYLDQLDQLKVMRQEEYQDPDMLLQGAEIELLDLLYKRQNIWPILRGMSRKWAGGRQAFGMRGVGRSAPGEAALADLLGEGYAPGDIAEHVLPEIDDGLIIPDAPEGMTHAQWYRQLLQEGDAQPMQGTVVNINQSGTIYNQDGKRSPAGRVPDSAPGQY